MWYEWPAASVQGTRGSGQYTFSGHRGTALCIMYLYLHKIYINICIWNMADGTYSNQTFYIPCITFNTTYSYLISCIWRLKWNVIEIRNAVCLYVSRLNISCHGYVMLQLAVEHGIKFVETSAKNSINVEEAFFTLARDIKAKMDRKLVRTCSSSLIRFDRYLFQI